MDDRNVKATARRSVRFCRMSTVRTGFDGLGSDRNVKATARESVRSCMIISVGTGFSWNGRGRMRETRRGGLASSEKCTILYYGLFGHGQDVVFLDWVDDFCTSTGRDED